MPGTARALTGSCEPQHAKKILGTFDVTNQYDKGTESEQEISANKYLKIPFWKGCRGRL